MDLRRMGSRNAAVLLVALLCVAAPPMASARRTLRSTSTSFTVKGRVFCDTCRAGFETPATTFISGAKVKVECKDRDTEELKFSAEGITDLSGSYNLLVANEHEGQICESVLVSSPDAGCAQTIPGRERASLVLTHNDGIPSNVRLANSMGFQKDTPLAGCAQIMKMYEQDENF